MSGSLALRYLLRHRIKAAILFIVITLMATALLAATMVRSATTVAARDVLNGPGAGFHLTLNQYATSYTPRGLAKIKADDIEQVEKLPGVKSAYTRQQGAANIAGKIVGIDGSAVTTAQDPQWANTVSLDAMNNSEGHTGFRTKQLTLTSGRHIRPGDDHTLLVHEELARLNGWKLGDKVTLSGHPKDSENTNQSSHPVTATIVGIFGGDNRDKASTHFELFADIVIADSNTLWDIYSLTGSNRYYNDANFLTDGTRPLDDVLAAGKKLNLDWKNLELVPNSTYLYTVNGTVKSLTQTTTIVVAVTTILALGVIALILALWQGARKKEVGVLLSLGRSKKHILSQRIIEMIPIAALAFAAAAGIAHMLAGRLSERALAAAQKFAQAQVNSVGRLGGDIETGQATIGLSSLHVQLNANALAITAVIVGTIIITAILATTLPTLRKTPRELIGSLS